MNVGKIRMVVLALLFWALHGGLQANLVEEGLNHLDSAPSPCAESADFVVCADPQPGAFLGTPQVFLDMIAEWNVLRPDLVMCAGDMIMGGPAGEVGVMWDEFLGNIGKLEVPFFPVPGNHDVNDEAEVIRIYEERVGPLYYTVSRGNALFVVLNTEEPGDPDGFSQEQRDWLRRTLEASSAEHIFIFLHVPFFAANWERDWQPTADIIKGHPVRAVFAGHEHYYRDYGVKDGVRYVIAGSAGGGFREPEEEGGFFCYLWVKVRSGHVSWSVVRPGSVMPADVVTEEGVVRLRALREMLSLETVAHPWDAVFDREVVGTLRNPFNHPVETVLRWTSPPGWRIDVKDLPVSIAPGESVALKTLMSHDGPLFFPAPALEGVVEDAETDTSVTLKSDLDLAPAVTVSKAGGKVVLDGDLSEWANAPELPMLYGVGYDPLDTEDLKASVRVMWDELFLYVAVESEDNEFHQPYYGDVIWMADSVELWIEQSNWSFSLTPKGPQVFAHDMPDKHMDSITTAVFLGVSRKGRQVVYEAAYPAAELPQVALAPGTAFGFSILVNDLDTSGPVTKRHWAELTPGAGAHFVCPKFRMTLAE